MHRASSLSADALRRLPASFAQASAQSSSEWWAAVALMIAIAMIESFLLIDALKVLLLTITQLTHEDVYRDTGIITVVIPFIDTLTIMAAATLGLH